MKQILLLLLLPLFALADATEPDPEFKKLKAVRTNQKIVIDGDISDAAWSEAAVADDFTEFRPVIGRKWHHEIRTVTYLLYDDNGIYFAGRCYESTPDSISRELAGRDGFGNNDYIGIVFDTYEDKLNGFEYFVTPLNEQWDAKTTAGGEDFSWNAVWESGARIHDKGWDFEMFIPYAAIRFAKQDKQNWGLQITRRRRKTEQQNCWNFFNPNVNGFLTQEGTWEGLENIKPPFRLQLFPYVSFYENHYPSNVAGQSNWSHQFAGGLDLKMGLNEAFTLDATIIPDFGQVQSDNRVLNLSPFEVRYNEYRSFFTEGTELFSKGDLFYSRRIGGSTLHPGRVYDGLSDTEEIVNNHAESKLINASKISGRAKNGLGVGFLNALTKPTKATILDHETMQTREVETDPLTNYNILVLDQNLKNNSSVSFINTSVIRRSNDYNANVSQVMTSLYDKKNTYNVRGALGVSYIDQKRSDLSDTPGIKYNVGISKNSGNFIFDFFQERVDTRFTSNDLGYFTNNNYFNNELFLSYRFQEPKGVYNKLFFNFGAWTSHLADKFDGIDKSYQNSGYRLNVNMQLKKLHWLGLFTNFQPKQNDFYEPRMAGKYFERGSRYLLGTWLESNFNKKYSINYEVYHNWTFNFYHVRSYGITANQNYRFNTRFSVSLGVNYTENPRGIGFSRIEENQPVFALRNVHTFDNVLSTKYNFNTKNWLTFRARHYNSVVNNLEFFNLNDEGRLSQNSEITNKNNQNINFFNIDMVYTWQFAPGSFVNVVWKNATFGSLDKSEQAYFTNLAETLGSDQNNNVSVKLIYFLDYQSIKKKS